jgi:hypothetical protein
MGFVVKHCNSVNDSSAGNMLKDKIKHHILLLQCSLYKISRGLQTYFFLVKRKVHLNGDS